MSNSESFVLLIQHIVNSFKKSIQKNKTHNSENNIVKRLQKSAYNAYFCNLKGPLHFSNYRLVMFTIPFTVFYTIFIKLK